ncbi:hypothetical protein VP01_2397g3 [Puccinia sorghi]|uniref:Uncharacterized protein n=1 Tax=Puccinia sorghi TaxID=27349 RepID=A0A0L6V6Y0_9BASI|nr:hypothetical protein VP01_2397g3 [Puccinia sorghi]
MRFWSSQSRISLVRPAQCMGLLRTPIHSGENWFWMLDNIFAFNPWYGELSWAMRNCGVEIAFLS